MPRKSLEVSIAPNVLRWGRESIGMNIEEVAKRLGTSAKTINKFESGEKKPTLIQINKLAKIYMRPLAVFFLSEIPKELPLPKDFRTLPVERRPLLSSKTRLAIRRARRLQSLAKEMASSLHRDIGFPIDEVSLIGRVSLSEDPEDVAIMIRGRLGVKVQTQFDWKNERYALNEWKKSIENHGVLVFQASMPVEETRAFSLTDGDIPIIIINSRDSIRARIFSLFHEYGHILLNKGGICDIEERDIMPEEVRSVEKFCNHFAGAILVPKDDIISHRLIKSITPYSEWPDYYLKKFAREFKVSQEVILRRLVILNLATRDFYKKKREEWKKQEAKAKEERRQKYLFSLEPAYRHHLVEGHVSSALRNSFKRNNLSLATEAKIIQKADKKWKLKDDKETYIIDDTGTLIKIYKQKKGGTPAPPVKCIHENGVPFVSLVLDSYKKEKITYSDVSDYLAIRLKHIPKVEQLVER